MPSDGKQDAIQLLRQEALGEQMAGREAESMQLGQTKGPPPAQTSTMESA